MAEVSRKIANFAGLMFTVLLILWLGVGLGFLLRRRSWTFPERLVPWTVALLLFSIGYEVGSNRTLLASLDVLGGEALCVTLFTVLGSALCAKMFQKFAGIRLVLPKSEPKPKGNSLLRGLGASLPVVGSFGLGGLAGFFGVLPFFSADWTFGVLCLLLACVGFMIGSNEEVRRSLKQIDRRLLLLPLVTVVGTWIGAVVTALSLPRHTMAEWLAVSSGFGYYSLSAILISDLRSMDLGTVALMHNVLREITVLLFAPFFVRLFGPLAPVSIGGATTADTTLPVIVASGGVALIPAAVFHGIVTDMLVPVLVPFFCAL